MSTRAFILNGMLMYEPAAFLTSIFDEKSGGLRISTSKSIIKRKLQVEVTNPSRGIPDPVVIDGCAIPWVLQWPSKGFTNDVMVNFIKYATNNMHIYRRTHVIFDLHYTSFKDATRCQQSCEASREYKLTMNAPMPQQEVVKNKIQLFDLICEELQKRDDVPLSTSLVITEGSNLRGVLPMVVRSDALVQIFGLKKKHEDTYVIIPHQVVALADVGCKTINGICDEHRCVCTTRTLLYRGKPVSATQLWTPSAAVDHPLI